MTVISPPTTWRPAAAVRAAYEHEGPVYLRFGRLAVPVFHDEATITSRSARANSAHRGQRRRHHRHRPDGQRGPEAAEQLKRRGHPGPGHQHPHHQASGRGDRPQGRPGVRQVITGEEHSVIGGLGEAVGAVLSEKLPHPCAPRGRAGRVRLLRPRMGTVRPAFRRHRGGCEGAGLR